MSAGPISNATIQEALQRAKQLAAQTQADTTKRPAEEEFADFDNPAKRVANGLDMAGNPIATLGGGYEGGSMPVMNMNNLGAGGEAVLVENLEVPDQTVGLIIGRGGESITNIQASSGCRVQMSQQPAGATRTCTLQGTKVQIERAKELIQQIIGRAGARPPPGRGPGGDFGGMPGMDGEIIDFGGGGPGLMDGMGGMGMPGMSGAAITHEMLVPGSKCGLVIGKGGETIKQIQERTGVKIVLIQDNQQASMKPKPLRIIGEPDKVEMAKQMVEEVMNSKDDNPPRGGNGGGGGMQGGAGGRFNEYGTMNRSVGEVIVPRSSVGMIIGRGGETIKRLAMESGAKIQFKQDEPNDDQEFSEPNDAQERTAIIQGSPEQIQKATQMISDLVNKSGESSDIFYMHIPAAKTGLVIGRGGETIKQINAESGAHVELSRDPPPNPTEKVFIIKGTPYQIHHAQHIIRIKVGDITPGTPVPPFTGPGGPQPGGPGGPGGQPGGFYGYPQQGWNGEQAPGQQPAADPNAAAWAAYYAQYGNGAGGAQYGQNAGQPQAAPQPAVTAAQPSSNAAPSINPATGQPDYSAAWAEYYRSMGMHDQAAMIEQQAKGGQPGAQPQQQQPQQPQPGQGFPAAYPGQPAYGQAYGQQGGQPQQTYQYPGQF